MAGFKAPNDTCTRQRPPGDVENKALTKSVVTREDVDSIREFDVDRVPARGLPGGGSSSTALRPNHYMSADGGPLALAFEDYFRITLALFPQEDLPGGCNWAAHTAVVLRVPSPHGRTKLTNPGPRPVWRSVEMDAHLPMGMRRRPHLRRYRALRPRPIASKWPAKSPNRRQFPAPSHWDTANPTDIPPCD